MNGRVFDALTEETLPGAHVYYKDANSINQGTVTDGNGTFDLPGAEGRQCFATYVGYEMRAFTGTPGPVDIAMRPGVDLAEVEITATRPGNTWPWLLALTVAVLVATD